MNLNEERKNSIFKRIFIVSSADIALKYRFIQKESLQTREFCSFHFLNHIQFPNIKQLYLLFLLFLFVYFLISNLEVPYIIGNKLSSFQTFLSLIDSNIFPK